MSRCELTRCVPGWLTTGSLAVALVFVAGCGSPATPKVAELPLKGVQIQVAAVGDAAVIPAVNAQRGEWEASRGANCTILDKPIESSPANTADVLVFRGDRLGDLVDAGVLATIPEASLFPPPPRQPGDEDRDADDDGPGLPPDAESSDAESLKFTEVISGYRDQVAKYGPDRMALPYGGSGLVLIYNRAAFDREANQAEAKKAGQSLKAPKTWSELDALAKFFHGRDWDGDGTKDSGIVAALGADPEGVGDTILLCRAAALGQHRDHYSLLFDSDSMAPRLTSPPFVEALKAHTALKALAPEGAEGLDANAAREAFRQGKAALLIDRAELAGRWGAPGSKVKNIGVAALPGSERVYDPANKKWEDLKSPNRPSYLPFGGGWLVAVSASATGKKKDAALDFVKYLVLPETSSRVRSDRDFPMLPVRGAQIAQGLPDPRSAPGVDSHDWSEAVSSTLQAERVVPGLRIPQAQGYLDDLSAGRVAALKGLEAEKALEQVTAAWIKRTETLGKERQLWHYRRSLNSLVTASKPPGR